MSGCFSNVLPPDDDRRVRCAEGDGSDTAPALDRDMLPDTCDERTGTRPRPDLQEAIDAFFDGRRSSFATKTAA